MIVKHFIPLHSDGAIPIRKNLPKAKTITNINNDIAVTIIS